MIITEENLCMILRGEDEDGCLGAGRVCPEEMGSTLVRTTRHKLSSLL